MIALWFDVLVLYVVVSCFDMVYVVWFDKDPLIGLPQTAPVLRWPLMSIDACSSYIKDHFGSTLPPSSRQSLNSA